MKNNLLFPLLSTSLLLLSACNGYKEVSYEEFIDKASNVPEHSYVSATLSVTDTNYNDGEKFTLKANYDSLTKSFVLEEQDLTYVIFEVTLNLKAKDTLDYSKQSNTAYQNNEGKYYFTNNSFTVTYKRSGEMALNNMTTKQSIRATVKYNKYGLLVSSNEESTFEPEGNDKIVSKTVLTVKYS